MMNSRFPAILSVYLLAGAVFTHLSLASETSEQARALFYQGKYKEMIKRLSDKAGDAKAVYWLSRAHEELGDYVKAQNVILNHKQWRQNPLLLARSGWLNAVVSNYEQAGIRLRRAFELNPDNLEVRLLYGEYLYALGQKAKARELLQYFVNLYRSTPAPDADLNFYTARACIYLNRFQDANDLFQEASKQRPQDWRIFVHWGNLFLEKYNYADAQATFQDALKQNPEAVLAKLGMAKAKEPTAPHLALKMVGELLDEHSRRLEVLLYAARLNLTLGEEQKAEKYLRKVLQIAPNHLEGLTLQAMLALSRGNSSRFTELVNTILRINPRYSRVYTEAGDFLSRRYWFREAATYYRKAIAIDSTDAKAYSGLGTTLSRLANLKEAIPALEKGFELDPYNLWTGNLLNLFDSYVEYDTVRTPHFIIRLHKDDRDVIGPYAAALAESAYVSVVPRYRLRLDFPVTIEIFPKHDDFAVRCFGLPGAQVFLGICFGPLITMNSPRARPVGTFNWMETLWHEFAHVVHLTLSNNRVPRWLAEGIAVYEATRANPAWDMNMDVTMIRALQKGELIPLKELDSGFTGDPGRVTFSYYQSSQMVKFIIEQFGFNALLQMLEAFKNNLKTAQVVKQVLKLNQDQFDERFEQYAKSRFPYKKIEFDSKFSDLAGDKKPSKALLKKMIDENPKVFFLKLRYAKMLLQEENYDEAVSVLEQARDYFPRYVGKDNPYSLLAEAYLSMGDSLKAAASLAELLQRNGKAYDAALQLWTLSREIQHDGYRRQALEALLQMNPYNVQIHEELGKLYLQRKMTRAAIREFRVLLALNPMDKANAHYWLARALLQANKKKEAHREILRALEYAPTFKEAQELLLRTLN